MTYLQELSYYNSHHICPFCQEKHPHMIYENERMFIIPARAPYIEDHLLIIPKRHVNVLKDLTHEELDDLHDLIDIWTTKLHTRHESVNLLLRDGLVGGTSSKSVNHLHFHLIPDCAVGSEGRDGPERDFFDDNEYFIITQKLRQIYQ